ncbi:NAD(P)H-hydrate dehydratase [Chryseosolibacter indicus]|uniref:Bifunctional NAD(P)H-hydrate repair enzyme n=1 Tax=Chryseosolibacter indicus TaxID=2782351 RepID=A0ABS5VVX7_9BACT|nr:NAD(P)H-hydrate dehydratase [Chryseosolibacter indicus]MBT1704975.1 NAD(P)H-hydrate dehydratase [Chryseosolibacter indicus]
MLKILDTKQIKTLDQFTIEKEPIASIDLMERACRAFVNWFTPRIDATKKIGIVCGTGNNGGDGLGIARLLKDWGYPVTVYIVKGTGSETEDFKVNHERIQGELKIIEISNEVELALFEEFDILIDALFGSGLSRPVEGVYAKVIAAVNNAEALTISVDVPSGLMADKPSTGEIVKADFTITFQFPKLAFLLPENYKYTGEWSVVDIGLSKQGLRESATNNFYITQKAVRRILKPRSKFSHKGTFGHALLIAGSYGKMGACVLSSRATLRAGVGLLTVHIPKCGYQIIQTAVPEAMALVDDSEEIFTRPGDLSKYNVIGIGPGLGKEEPTIKAFAKVLEQFRKPLVIDADALNILSSQRELLHLIPENSILTPHPKEFERLVGEWKNDFERLEKQKQLAASLKSIIIVKGANSSVATPEGQIYFNSSGNPGMATGGTGDVLTGVLTSLVAQSYNSVEAAIIGVYLHGLSADLVAQERGMSGLIASDVVDFLPLAYKKLLRA